MKRTAVLLLTIFLCSAIFLFAGDQNKKNANDMTGWVCNAKCVDQSSGKATCNTKCAESSGQIVFIDDSGKVLNIANQLQDKARPMAGKHCKMTATVDPDTGTIDDFQNMLPLAYGP